MNILLAFTLFTWPRAFGVLGVLIWGYILYHCVRGMCSKPTPANSGPRFFVDNTPYTADELIEFAQREIVQVDENDRVQTTVRAVEVLRFYGHDVQYID